MCGFSGFTNPSSEKMAESILKNMMAPIKHRGPDAESIFINDKIALGHYRLSIIDIDGGYQPRIDNENKNYLVFNGEIYEYKKHAKLLQSYGINLKDQSDTEVLFQSLIHLGVEKTLEMIDGMYAFVFYEGKNDTIWLIRDPMGEKPLYYSTFKNNIYFSSEASGVVASNTNKPKNINKDALLQYLHLDYIPEEKSLFEGVQKILPGQYIKISKNEIIKKNYFSFSQNQKKITTLKEATESIDFLLEKSIKERLIADVPVGIFLSGGIDSSLIAYYAKKFHSNIASFTIKMKNDTYDESSYAKLVAEKLGIQNNIAEFNSNEIIKSLEIIENKMDEPLGDPSILPTFLLSKFAKESVKVALSGDGADELFCGYAPFKSVQYLKFLSLIPQNFGHIITSFMEKIPSQDNYMSYHFLIKHISRGFGWPSHQQVFRWMSPFSDNNILKLLNKEFTSEYSNKKIWDEILPKKKHTKNNSIDELSTIFRELYLPNDILTKVDRASMYNGLEVRSPFLSKEIINFSLNLPNKYKFNNGETKFLLRNLSKTKLPKIIATRKKHGFAIPLAKMMRGALKEKIEDTLLSSNNMATEFFDRKNIEKTLKDHEKGIDNRKPIWAIYMLYKATESLSKY
jgi:asparagine synthase (glutamine-hydrolysing)